MEVYLIRHTTPDIPKGLIYGRLDVPLAHSFQKEKELVLLQVPPSLDAVYSSPSSRCMELSAGIAATCISANAGYATEEGFYEMNFGDWEGKTWDTIDREASEIWMNDFVHLSPPKGESMLGMQKRVIQSWERIINGDDQKIAIVTHGGVIRIILAHYQGISLKNAFDIQVGFGQVFKLQPSTALP
ncbi:alpha-ribazole phosphatase [Pedobacter sp. AW31-3R]|uniref:alpha-ribazole phosphatase n=1 Tax=Pedobacter sp. AW31-3R TaxID=3445781 RepID=UPI003FA1551D